MGGDQGPSIVLPAVRLSLKKLPDLKIILVGDKTAIDKYAAGLEKAANVSIVHTTEQVEMDEQPASALRNKKRSSMRLAIDLVKEGVADAAVSAGNTGALMVIARFVLKMLPGVDRPAIIGSFPTFSGHTHILDLGANVDCTPEHLYQFAVMGSVLTSVVDGIPHPKIGLLNVGSEEIKGNEAVKSAAKILQQQQFLNYVGYVEGDDIFKGKVDVIVCDGFVGNVMLKACEGLTRLLVHYTKTALTQHWLVRLLALPARFLLKDLKTTVDPDKSNGACLVGLNGIVVKSHGSAKVNAFACAVEKTYVLAKMNVVKNIVDALQARPLLGVE